MLLILFYFLVLRRRRQKYRHPEDKSKTVDTIESPPNSGFVSKSFQDDWGSVPQHGRTTSLFTNQQNPNHSLVTNGSQYLKHPYSYPSSFTNERLAARETHYTPSDQTQSPTDTLGPEFKSLRSNSTSSTIKPPPLSIPQTSLNHSNGKRSTKRKDLRQMSQLSLQTDDSASVYSEASAARSTPPPSTSFLVITPLPPVPIPLRSTSTTQSGVMSIRRREEEETIINKPLLSEPLPALKFNRDEAEAEEDRTEIYNVAKLLHSRQSKLPIDSNRFSRNPSIVSHIERSGSIKPVISPLGEEQSEPYRPRYYRLKQRKDSYASNSAMTASFPPGHSRDSQTPRL